MTNRILESALNTASLGLSIFPIHPSKKTPAFMGWQDSATDDPDTIEAWFAANPNHNYGVLCGVANDLVVIDLDGPDALAWWAEQNIPAGAIVTTPSGPDRQHHYYFTDETDIQTNKAKLHPHVDVRAVGGYVVGPGSVLPAGVYAGELDNIPNAPQKLLDLLPRRTAPVVSIIPQVSVEPVDAASASENRQVAKVIHTLEGLPREWSEGAGWRSTMYQMGCWLARMVNSPAYAMTEDRATTILLTHTPTNEAWAESEILVQWESAKKSAEGQMADAPEETFPDLPPFLTVANLLPASFDSKLYMDEPDIRTEQAYTSQRHALATAALTAKLDDTQTAALVWGSVAGKPLQAAPSGLRTLWAEVARAKADLPDTSLATVTPIRPVATFTATNIELLHGDERVTVAGYNWFGVEYLAWINSKPIVVNLPYHRMNRWTILSRVFSQHATLYHPAKPVGLNLYQFVVGGSSSGKTESFEFAEQVMRAYLNLDRGDRPVLADITKVSPNQLHAKLIERDGDTSLVRTDEAQAFFEQVKGSEWQRGLIDDFAKYYDGRFAAKLMANDKENSDKESFGDLIVHFTGITEMVMQNLELSHWQSGFLLRCVWAIGNPSTPRSRSTDVEDDDETPNVLEHDKMPDQFAAKFQKATTALTRLGGGNTKAVLRYTPEAKARHRLLENDLEDALSAHPMYESVLRDYCTRFAISVNKCAAMVAASEGVGRITVEHELVAIEQAEEWLGFALAVLAKTGNTRFDRQCQELLEFVKNKPSGRVDAVDVYRKYRPAAQADALLRQLEVEQRITRKTDVTSKSVIEFRKEAA